MPVTRASTRTKDSSKSRQVPLDAVSNSGSRVSSRNSVSSTRSQLLLAELKEKQLKEELELETREQELSKQRRLLKARQEVEFAQRSALLEDEQGDVDLPALPIYSSNRVDEFVTECAAAAANQPSAGCYDDLPIDPPTATLGNAIASALVPLIAEAGLPKVELAYFDGHPADYWRFVKQFEFYVESKVVDDGRRLLYLIHYCKGRARLAIGNCVMLPPGQGYERARRILRDLFGQAHYIARASIEGLLQGAKSIPNNADALSELAIKMENCHITLKQMNYEADVDSSTTLEEIVRALPKPLQYKWAEIVDQLTLSGHEPSFLNLTTFVSSRARIARSRFGQLADRSPRGVETTVTRAPPRKEYPAINSHYAGQRTKSPASPTHSCPVCSDNHLAAECGIFRELDISQRWEMLKTKNLCFGCLRPGHIAKNCGIRRACNAAGCQSRHHSLLHGGEVPKLTHAVSTDQARCGVTDAGSRCVALGVIPVTVVGPFGSIETYALLDNGSDTTLITQDLVGRLRLEPQPSSLTIKTINGDRSMDSSVVKFYLRSLNGLEEIEVERAFAVPSLPIQASCHGTQAEARKWPHLADLDFEEIRDPRISLLIGCDIPEAHWVLDQRLGGCKEPYAIKTLLGWIVLGPLGSAMRRVASVNGIWAADIPIADQIQMLYNAEFSDFDALELSMSCEDSAVVAKTEAGTRLVHGHYVVPLPWRDGSEVLSSNRVMAEKRLAYLKRRLLRDGGLFSKYTQSINSMLDKGYAVRAPAKTGPRCWYLPHHAIVNPKKPEKLRVVLDCAAKFRGRSLNDQLCQGPDVTANLTKVLTRFRKNLVALAADVEEMYMQVKVPEDDQGALRFLWWPKGDLSSEPVDYQMTAHPFGATSSPFCATYALRKTVSDFGHLYNATVTNAVTNGFYVDDCLVSLSSVEEAAQFAHDICELLAKGGFRLRKWISNKTKALDLISPTEWARAPKELVVGSHCNDRTLGLEWNAETDQFWFRFSVHNCLATRRSILSTISSMFDPLGLVCPLLLPAKVLLQKLCRRGLGWDDPLQPSDEQEWKQWINHTLSIGQLSVPRCVLRSIETSEQRAQLHIFSDASEIGYGVVAYLRHTSALGQPYCSLLLAKSRVAPLKATSIPRLELGAAVLAAKVNQILADSLSMSPRDTRYWTDSQIVLHYIYNKSTRFSTFVANRIAAIQQLSEPTQWNHVRSKDNAADLTSRGTLKLSEWRAWVGGPDFLLQTDCSWVHGYTPTESMANVELKKPSSSINATSTNPANPLLTYFSSWAKLLKAVAWLVRFKCWLLSRHNAHRVYARGPLLVSEIEDARKDILRMVQRETFSNELTNLKACSNQSTHLSHAWKKRNPIRRLYPTLIEGIICVGGRLNYTDYEESLKHPAILPSRHPVVEALVRHFHVSEGHGGVHHVLSAIRTKYWILHGAKTVKRVVGSCIRCWKRTATPCQQQMAPLPCTRAEIGWFPFKNVGVDYFGPIVVKRGRTVEKRFGCIFNCLQTRAVHLEAAHDLSTDAFITALIRFVGRRGCPSEVYSDNGTNFVGAVRELLDGVKKWDQKRIDGELCLRGLQWHFNPPFASHRGGVWERIIRSVRKILHGVCNEQRLTDDSLATVFVEVERILNNRPLVPPTSDSQDAPPLTPNSLLLIRCETLQLPDIDIRDRYTKRWKQVAHVATGFWKRWLKEYITTLQSRQKWQLPTKSVEKDELVLVASEKLPRGCWPLGRVVSCEASNDGLVRTVYIRTNSGIVKRDVRKVCRLEGDE
ncbi:unnamed protein product [Dicrocoelium dendriticum]|nr:unnamed protein product [Dicrocoelium dendriticum]